MPDPEQERIQTLTFWSRAREVFAAGLGTDPEEQEALLDLHCQSDRRLRIEVLSLLEAHRAATGFLEQPSISTPLDLGDDDPFIGRQLGPYKVVSELARGGMGVVYGAVRDDGAFDRRVAIKCLPAMGVTEESRRRFQAERRILADLQHPNIASVLDGGATHEGVLYLVMELVDGRPIDRFAREQNLSIQRKIDLFLQVAGAVQFAHQRLVVHRDLKPGNILVTSGGEPKLLDFGIAKLLDQGIDGDDDAPTTRLMAMTPEYASPEQIRGEPITTASDVYSLGVLLYTLLSDHHPYVSPGGSPFMAAQAACDVVPIAPSKKMDRQHPDRHTVAGDLDAICLRAIEKRPEQRYRSVAELEEDLRRFLGHRPVEARKGTIVYRAKRFVRRNRWAVSAAALAFGVGLLFVLVTAHERRVADQARMRAERIVQVLTEILTTADPWNTDPKSQTTSNLLSAATEQVLSEKLDGDPQVRAGLLTLLGEIYFKVGMVDQAEELLTQAVEIFEATCVDDCTGFVDALIYYGNVHKESGDFESAEQHYQEALAISQRQHGEAHIETGHGYKVMGLLRHRQGRLEEAEDFHRSALEILREVTGSASIEVADSLGNLAGVLWSQGEHAKATEHYQQALAIKVGLLEPDHPAIASIHSSLGALLQRKDPAAAEQYLRLALAAREKHLTENSSGLAITRNNLASVLNHLGRFEEAEPMLRLAVPNNHHAHYNLAEALEGLGRYDDALFHYQEAYNVNLELWQDPDLRNLSTGVVLSSMAGLYSAIDDSAQCEIHARNSLDNLRQVEFRPDDAPYLAEAEAILGGCLAAQGRVDEGEPLMVNSLEPLSQDWRRRGILLRQTTLQHLISLAEAKGAEARAARYRTMLRNITLPG